MNQDLINLYRLHRFISCFLMIFICKFIINYNRIYENAMIILKDSIEWVNYKIIASKLIYSNGL